MVKYKLVGIGIGPFNLSLAAVLEKTPHLSNIFLDKKPAFDWHPELMFDDSTMQTSYLKDLVTPVDPTNRHSFMNYLVESQLFYPFVNTQRSVVTRREFELYCRWVSGRLEDRLRFDNEVRSIQFRDGLFHIRADRIEMQSENICIGTGPTPRIPECAKQLLGPRVFHAKSPLLQSMNLTNKRLFIVGGGQTGIEIFRSAMGGKWGSASAINLITQRSNLEPLDESAFTNDYFTPNYVESFWDLPSAKKAQIVAGQKLASDGNTPSYLYDLYNDLYQRKLVHGDRRELRLMACRRLLKLHANASDSASGYRAVVENHFLGRNEELAADIVILCTGFESVRPAVIDPLISRMALDEAGRFQLRKSYAVQWDGPTDRRIYALNFSRHQHGIVDPQTSMMAWRSAVVVNDLAGEEIYGVRQHYPNFIDYGESAVAVDVENTEYL